MKKIFSPMVVCLILLTSCAQGVDEPVKEKKAATPKSPSSSEKEVFMSTDDLAGTSWFYGDAQLQFPLTDETLYIKYLPDTLHVTQWISLKENSNKTYTAKIEWSENIREIGKTAETIISKKGNVLAVRSELFTFTNMASYEGVTASNFDVNQVPPLQSQYLSNFDGNYSLKSYSGWTFSVKAKACIKKDTTHYWNANILNAQYDETTKSYDLLLAHTSSNNGSGSIDPGITGSEPFISRQGVFWSHLTLTANPGSLWDIKWSSVWYDSPYEALNSNLDMADSFTGPETSEITYKYHFYFGEPGKDASGWCTVVRGNLIKDVEYKSPLPTDETWSEILARAGTISIPDDKLLDYWWYSTNSITSIESSYVYKLTDSCKPSLTEYYFYCKLKDKPAGNEIYFKEGTYVGGTNTLIISNTSLTYNGTVYTYVQGQTRSTAKDGVSPLFYAYLLSDGTKNYLGMVAYYTNNSFNYVKLRPPKEFDGSEIPAPTDWSSFNSLLRTSFTEQK